MSAAAVSAPNAPYSQTSGSPAPSVHVTAPSRPATPPHSTLPQSPGSVSGPSSATTSCVTLNSPATASSSNLGSNKAAAQRKEFRDALVDAEGEIPVLDEHDDTWTLIRSGPLATKGSGENSWTDLFGGLTDKHLFLLKEETDPDGTTRRSHAEQPIPLECLCLGPFDEEPQIRKQDSSFFKLSCFSSSSTETLYPFVVYHAAARMTRRSTLYSQSATERSKWRSALNNAVEARTKAQQDLYRPETLNGDFFRTPPPIQFTRGVHYTGCAVCATEFSVRGEDYIAVGCASGIYVSKRTADSFRKVLDSSEPKSLVAIPEFDKFLVHCDSALHSYPLDMIALISQGDATPGSIGDSEEILAGARRDVLFFRAGRVANRTLIIYAAKGSKQSTLHVLELTGQRGTSFQYQTLGSPRTMQEEPRDVIFFPDKVAICTSKTIYIMEQIDATSPLKAWPEFPNSKCGANGFQRVLQGTRDKAKALLRLGNCDKPKILELVGRAGILGMVKYGNNTLIVYDEFGCFIDEHGKPTGSPYYVSWDTRATTYALCGSHLLLFSPGFIEVRNLETGTLVQVIKAAVRSLCRGCTEQGMLIAAMNGEKDRDGSCRERLVELVRDSN